MPQIQSNAQSLLPRRKQSKKSPRRLSVTESLQNLARNTFHIGRRNATTTCTAMSSSTVTPPPSTRSVSWPSGSPTASTLRAEQPSTICVTPRSTRVPAESLHNPRSRIPTPMPIQEPLRKALSGRLNGSERRTSKTGVRVPDTISDTNSARGQQTNTTHGNIKKGLDAGNTPPVSRPRKYNSDGCRISPGSKSTRGSGLPATSLTLSSTPPGQSLGRMSSKSSVMRNQSSCTSPHISFASNQHSSPRLTPLNRKTTPIGNARTASAVKACRAPQRQSLQPLGNQLPKSQSMGNMVYNKPRTIYISPKRSIYQYDKGGRERSSLSICESAEDIDRATAEPPKTNDENRKDNKTEVLASIDVPNTVSDIPACQMPGKQPSDSTNMAPEDVRLVTTAKPQQYWLGRFTTLTNAFRYEESFNEPDTETGYSRPKDPHHHTTQSTTEGRVEDQRTIRVLIFLERACTTEEAKASFLEFRTAYSKKYGEKWVKSLDAGGGDEKLAGMKKLSGSLALEASTISSMRDMHKEQRKSIEFGTTGGMALMNVFRTMRRSLA